MKFLPIVSIILIFTGEILSAGNKREDRWFENAIRRSEKQLSIACREFYGQNGNPRTFENGKVQFVSYTDWTSGFFPGSLWYMYELTGKKNFQERAEYFTSIVEKAALRTNTHDLGFILYCSYGNAYRIQKNEKYLKILTTGANSLMKRYNHRIGLIKSWDKNVGNWEFPVIIDNMMNLEFLYEAGKLSGNQNWMDAAVSHADKTLSNHFRSNHSSYHVVEYDSISGLVKSKETHQGFQHESTWSRGQAWGLYGFTMMYRLTSRKDYLQQAINIADFLLNHPRMPEDNIPYWDMDAPGIPYEPRDASAAAITASALLELSKFTDEKTKYLQKAEQILRTLSSGYYLANPGSNGLFLLKHSTGNFPKKSEIDTPLAYADYYYLEALKRYKEIRNK